VSGNRERAAYHEAGHCAAAIAFGIPIIAPSKPMRDTCTVVIIGNEPTSHWNAW
jgi:hypothetical protein